MTVSELIRELQKFPPDTLVLKYRAAPFGAAGYWETMDGHWFQMVEVYPNDQGRYYERPILNDKTVDALEL